MSDQSRPAVQAEDHFQQRFPSDPQISPDGRHVAFARLRADVDTDGWVSEVCVVDTASGAQRELGRGSQPRWAPDSRSLALVVAADSGFAIERWHVDSGDRAPIARLAEPPSGLAWSPDGARLGFVKRVPDVPVPVSAPAWEKLRTARWAAPGIYSDKLVRRVEGFDGDQPDGHHHIFVLTLATGAVEQLTHGAFEHGGPLVEITKMSLAGRISWTPDGRHIVMSMQRHAPPSGPLDPATVIDADVWEFDLADGAVRRLSTFGGPVCRATASPDGRWIAFVGYRNRRAAFQTNVVHLMPRAGGEIVALPHLDALEVDQGIQWLPDSSGLLTLMPHEGAGCLVRVTLAGEWTTLDRGVGGGAGSGYVLYMKGLSVARDGRVACLRGSRDRIDEVMVLPAGGGSGTVLTNESGWLAERVVAPVETLWLPTRSGRDWQAWLVRPAGVPADVALPLILWLHGGPYLAWSPDFAIVPQIWAGRGYAVLMINPPGSLGYGEAFTDALEPGFPGPDDLQLLDCVEAVVARGGIDAARVHVAGESAGGVLTSWLIGHSRRFVSAAVIYGVMDWTSQMLTVDRPDYFAHYRSPAPPWEPGMHEHHWRRSSLSLVAAVRTPTLVLCGEKDTRTPIVQSEMYYTALKLCGVDAALVRYPDDNHSLEWHPSHWLDLVEQVDRWFRRHDGRDAG
ncbi:MAG: prolyl oligopeptidase family serine peptidase [Betaproteobacteria bacterium]